MSYRYVTIEITKDNRIKYKRFSKIVNTPKKNVIELHWTSSYFDII